MFRVFFTPFSIWSKRIDQHYETYCVCWNKFHKGTRRKELNGWVVSWENLKKIYKLLNIN